MERAICFVVALAAQSGPPPTAARDLLYACTQLPTTGARTRCNLEAEADGVCSVLPPDRLGLRRRPSE